MSWISPRSSPGGSLPLHCVGSPWGSPGAPSVVGACGQRVLCWGPVFLHGPSLGSSGISPRGAALEREHSRSARGSSGPKSRPNQGSYTGHCCLSARANHGCLRMGEVERLQLRGFTSPPVSSPVHPSSCPSPERGQKSEGSGLPRTLTGKKEPKLIAPGNGGGGH